MPSGKKPLAPEIKERIGSYTKHAGRRNDACPMADGEVPEDPGFLTPCEMEKWMQLLVDLHGMGLQCSTNRELMLAYVTAYSGWKSCREQIQKDGGFVVQNAYGEWVRHPLLGDVHKFKATMIKLLPEFGLTPSSRGRMVSFKETKTDDVSDILQRLGVNNN